MRSQLVVAVLLLSSCRNCDPPVDPPGTLTGRVCFESGPGLGLGIPGIEALATNVATGERFPTRTDANGNMIPKELAAGRYSVTALGLVKPEVAVESSRTTVLIDPACREPPPPAETGCVRGKICNRHTGTLYDDLQVQLRVGDDVFGPVQVDPDTNEFRVCGGTIGEAVLEVLGDYARAFPVNINSETDDTIIDLADECYREDDVLRGNVSGTFCTTSGVVPGTIITLTGPVQGDPIEAQDVIDSDGNFYLSGLRPGDYETVAGPFITTVTIVANVTATVSDTVNCPTDLFGRVEGRLCDAGIGVDLLLQDRSVLTSTTTAADGSFAFVDVEPATYFLSIRAAIPRTIGSFEVFANDRAIPVNETVESCAASICVDETIDRSDVIDGRILFVLDRSGSMNKCENGQECVGNQESKWRFTTRVLADLLENNLAPAVETGLLLYPAASANDDHPCDTGQLFSSLLDNNRAGIIAEMRRSSEGSGGTPTARSLFVAYDELVRAQSAGPGRPLAVVLATDGGPNCDCAPQAVGDICSVLNASCVCSDPDGNGACRQVTCLDDGNTYAAIGAIRDLGVNTYVIGTGVASFAGVMNLMAQAGNTSRPGELTDYYPVEDVDQLTQAINAVTERIAACTITVPGTGNLTTSVVTMSIDDVQIPRDVTEDNGWNFRAGSERTVEIFGPACDRVNDSANDVAIRICAP